MQSQPIAISVPEPYVDVNVRLTLVSECKLAQRAFPRANANHLEPKRPRHGLCLEFDASIVSFPAHQVRVMSRFQWFALTLLFCGPVLAQEPIAKSDPLASQKEAVPVESEEKPLNFWMQKKLNYSTGILRGLSMGDFELIETKHVLSNLSV